MATRATQTEIYNNAEKISEDLLAHRLQISISTPESVIVNAYNGGTLRLIGGNAGKLPHFIIARPDIRTLAQLRGARFGVLSLNEGTTNLIHILARVAGLDEDTYEILPVGGAPTQWRLLQENRIDVGLQPFPLSYEAEDAGFTNLGPIADYVPDYQFTSINVDMTWARDNRALVVGFLRSLKRGYDYMTANPDEAVEIASRELRTSTTLAKRALQDTTRLKILSANLSVSERGLKFVFGTLKSIEAISEDETFDLKRVFDDSYRAAVP